MEIENNIRRSDEIQDFMGKMPHWLVRWGNLFVVILFTALVVGACLIKYPDLLVGNMVITSDYPPAKLIAKESGRLNLLVHNGDDVKQKEYIGYIENAAEYKDVVALKAELPLYEKISKNPLLINPSCFKFNFSLGELQDVYSDFKSIGEKYFLFIELQQDKSRIDAIRKQLGLLETQKEILIKKKEAVERERNIALRQYGIDSALYRKTIISHVDLDMSEEKYISVCNKLGTLEEELLNVRKSIQVNNSAIDELLINSRGEREQLESAIKNSFEALQSKFKVWEQKYVLFSPIDGRVSFYDFWSNNQSVTAGDEVAYIVNDVKHVFARLTIAGSRFGKVKKGQRVRLLLDSYPTIEYGVILGKVMSISEINKNNTYSVSVSLDQGLLTNYNERIPFMPEMKGKGEIVTQDMSLIKRIFYKTQKMFVSKK